MKRLKELRQNFLRTSRNDVPGLLAARTYSQSVRDSLQKTLASGVFAAKGWALVAVGGFGRGELSFASDLDLLFLHSNRLPQVLQDVVRELVYGLWDDGFEVGHATASVSAVNRLAREDFTILTNYLEVQFIAGDRDLFTEWRKSFLDSFGAQRRRRFLRDLVKSRETRLMQYGESAYLLEPHVKDGVGGLRDLQMIQWAGCVYLKNSGFASMIELGWLSHQEVLWLEQAYDFLWRVRLQLHQLNERRQDRLLFPEQEQIAVRLGLLNNEQGSAVEAFMRLYYRHTTRIRRITSFFLERLEETQPAFLKGRFRKKRILDGPFLLEGRHLHFLEPEWARKDPRLLMQFFRQAAQSDAHFHHQAGHVIRESLNAFDDAARRDPLVVKQFFDILLDPLHSFRVLKVMLETGLLQVFMPEFAALRYKVQYDVYHLYTVDEHLLRTVRELHRMEQGTHDDLAQPGLSNIFVQVENRRVLYLAALTHDIGKGQGKNHAVRGAEMVRNIAERCRLDSKELELLSFLTEKHLLLADTALKRDLTDEKPLLRCAFEIGDAERLRLLYLLTIADSRATGPGAWNTWKASLLRELYMKVDGLLSKGEWKKEQVEERSEEVQRAVIELTEDIAEREKVSNWLDSLSFRYLLSQPSEAIIGHYQMEKELGAKPVVLHTKPTEGGIWQITIAAQDRAGLFAVITGVLWYRGLNILSAEIFTRQSGIALDVIMVEHLPDPLHSTELWANVESDLVKALSDRSYLTGLIAGLRRTSPFLQKNLPRKEDKVLIDEEESDFYTIIEVYTWDRPGVLHCVTNALFELDITIQLAKISTPGAQVADVFYVTDLAGNKLMDANLHEKIRQSLLKSLSSEQWCGSPDAYSS
ncbi:MAG: [protein-PII] uridylyltransferase [Syntrophobacteraceae bacterium]